MQFKHPEFLYFLFLLAIPILVHLFQLRRFKNQPFTNVSFLKDIIIQTRKSSKLKKWLLLFTRLLLLTFLILAFCQPFFEAKDSKNTNNELHIVLDNSWSMQAKGSDGELMKRAVEELLENVPENSSFSFYTANESFYSTDIKSLQPELQKLTYSSSTFDLNKIINKIKNNKSQVKKDIVVITDAVGLETKNLSTRADNYRTFFILKEAQSQSNVAIDSVYIHQTLDNFYEIGVSLKTFGNIEKSIPLSIFDNKKLIAKTQVSPEAVNKPVFFTLPKNNFHGYASIEDGSLVYDNTFYFSLDKPKKSRILSIGQEAEIAFLSKIYTPDAFDYTHYTLKNLDYNAIENQDAIVLNELPDLPTSLQITLKDFLEKGGTLIVIPAKNSIVSHYNRWLSSLGNITFSDAIPATLKITSIAFNHPLYNDVFEKRVTNFQYPETNLYFPIKTNGQVALRYENQSEFLSQIKKGNGTLFLFASPLSKENSNFLQSPLVVPTFFKMGNISKLTGCNALTLGKEETILLDAVLGKDQIISLTNEKEKSIPNQQSMGKKVKLMFIENPQTAGNFSLQKENENVANISFNYARTESDLVNKNTNIIDYGEEVTSISQLFSTMKLNRTANEWWRILLIMALVCLFLEILIQKFVK